MATYFMVLVFRILQKLPNVTKWVARLFYITRRSHGQTSVHPQIGHPVICGPIQSLKANGATVQPSYDLYLSHQLQIIIN